MTHSIRTKMDHYKLAEAGRFGWMFPLVQWPVKRCTICGKLCRPGTDDRTEFIEQVRRKDENPLYSICRDHGGSEGTDYIDALTGCTVHADPSPYFIKKVLSDWFREGVYWFGLLARYVWYVTLRPYWWIACYPIKTIRYFLHKKEIDDRWTMWG